jgi:hypothetical protein
MVPQQKRAMSRCRRGTAAAVALLAWSWACTPRPGGELAVTDSLGVSIVELPPLGDLVSEPPASATLTARFGGSDAPEGDELIYVRGLVPIVRDALVVAGPAAHGIRRFGLHQGATEGFGSEGEGPGEFLYPAVAGPHRGDSVVVYDARLRRVTILDVEGGYRSYPVPAEVGPFASAVGVLSSGHVAFSGGYGLSLVGRERVIRDTVPIVVLDVDGHSEASFGGVRTTGYYEGPPDLNPRALNIPFSPGDRVAAGGRGIYVAFENRAEVWRYDANGSLLLILRFRVPDLPITDAQVDSVREEEARTSRIPEGVRTLFARMPLPERHPPFDQLVVDSRGLIWILPTAAVMQDGAQWFVFEPDGMVVGSYRLPRGELLGVTVDRAVLLTHDEYDSSILEVYELDLR